MQLSIRQALLFDTNYKLAKRTNKEPLRDFDFADIYFTPLFHANNGLLFYTNYKINKEQTSFFALSIERRPTFLNFSFPIY